MATSVHDNYVVSYEIQCERREIRLLTERRSVGKPVERVLVLFTGVEAYDLRYDCMGNILYEVQEITVEEIINEHLAELQEGHRLSGWPRFWRGSLDEVYRLLRERATRGFEVTSSYGMRGWVLAREMQMIDAGLPVAENNNH